MSQDNHFVTIGDIRENLRHYKSYETIQAVPFFCPTYFGIAVQANDNQPSTSSGIQNVDSDAIWLQNFGSYQASASADTNIDTQALDSSTSNADSTDNNTSTLYLRPFQDGYNVGMYDPRQQFGNYSSQVGMPFNNQRMYQHHGYGNFDPNHPSGSNTWQYPPNHNMPPNCPYNSGYPAPYNYGYPQKYYAYPNQNPNQNYPGYQGWPRQIAPCRLPGMFRSQSLNNIYGQMPSDVPTSSQQSNRKEDTSTKNQNTNKDATDPKNRSNDDPKAGPSTSSKTSNEESGSAKKTESRVRNKSRSDRSHSRERSRRRSLSRRRSSSRARHSRSSYSLRRSKSLSPSRLRNISPRDRFGSRSERQDKSSSQSNRREKSGRQDDRKERGGSFKTGKERQKLIKKWRLNNCSDQDEMNKRLEALFHMKPDEIMAEENKIWIRSAPADCFYERDAQNPGKMIATDRLKSLCDTFKFELLERGKRAREAQTLPVPPPLKPKRKLCNHKGKEGSSGHDSDADEGCNPIDAINSVASELERKQKHPYRLHPELWFNDPGEMNDGPLCRCSAKARRSGIRHGFYAGDETVYTCDPMTNNAGKLYHYRITISPPTNFLTRCPTIINYDDHEFIFEGFSLISHYKIEKLPVCKVIRFNIEYIILYIEEKCPENFCIEEVDLFYNYLFKEILELMDFDLHTPTNKEGCPHFHFMPRFVRELPDNGRELLPMCEVLNFMLRSNQKLFEEEALGEIQKMSKGEWQNFADSVKGMIVTNPGMKPSSIRVDQVDRETDEWLKKYGKGELDRRSNYPRRKRSFPRDSGKKSDESGSKKSPARGRGKKSDDSRGKKSTPTNNGNKSDDSRGGKSPARDRGKKSGNSRSKKSTPTNNGNKSDDSRGGKSPVRGRGYKSDDSHGGKSPVRGRGYKSDDSHGGKSPVRGRGNKSDDSHGEKSPVRGRGNKSDDSHGGKSPVRGRGNKSDDSHGEKSPVRGRGNKSDDSQGGRTPPPSGGNRPDDAPKSADGKGVKNRRTRRGRRGRKNFSLADSSQKKPEGLQSGTPSTKAPSQEKEDTSNNDKNTPVSTISTDDKAGCSGEGNQNGNNESNTNVPENGESSTAADKNPEGSKENNTNEKFYPDIVHFGIRPPQLSYAGNPEYQKAWRKYVKLRHLIANMAKPTREDKQKLATKESNLHAMRAHSKMKRDVTVTVSSKGFYLTGLMCDVVQHAMLIPVLVCHLRFHHSLHVLENTIQYTFQDKFLLQLALTHPSYRENFGTNSDHARNSLTNCGIRQPKYGDKRIHYMNTRKRGINTLINIMSRFGKKSETQSNIYHNERLEFLGDAVVEFITSTHLFHIFRDLEEGGLATYRAALVQNQHLAVLAKKLNLDQFMLYAHGSDLCHDLELRHAMANCFEALMGALFLDGGIEAPDKVLANVLYDDDADCLDVWSNYPQHILQEQEPTGDRKWIPHFPFLQKLTEFEKATGIEFTHIRLLARAFTDRSVGFTNLTLGSNQRLEFLGDSVLQLISSEYLYKYFPEHHEGHLSLLRSSLVNNKTQSVVCDDLGMTHYALYANPKVELKVKDRADLLEAFLGALFVDDGLEVCRVFCEVCFFPRLQLFIMNQDWNDPKSKLQQCCLTLRTMDNTEPDIPVYKVVECKGPTNTRVYTVAVYFRNKRLAKATGHSIQQAEMNAALKAMEESGSLFPQLDHQKRVIAKSMRNQKLPWSSNSAEESRRNRRDRGREVDLESD